MKDIGCTVHALVYGLCNPLMAVAIPFGVVAFRDFEQSV